MAGKTDAFFGGANEHRGIGDPTAWRRKAAQGQPVTLADKPLIPHSTVNPNTGDEMELSSEQIGQNELASKERDAFDLHYQGKGEYFQKNEESAPAMGGTFLRSEGSVRQHPETGHREVMRSGDWVREPAPENPALPGLTEGSTGGLLFRGNRRHPMTFTNPDDLREAIAETMSYNASKVNATPEILRTPKSESTRTDYRTDLRQKNPDFGRTNGQVKPTNAIRADLKTHHRLLLDHINHLAQMIPTPGTAEYNPLVHEDDANALHDAMVGVHAVGRAINSSDGHYQPGVEKNLFHLGNADIQTGTRGLLHVHSVLSRLGERYGDAPVSREELDMNAAHAEVELPTKNTNKPRNVGKLAGFHVKLDDPEFQARADEVIRGVQGNDQSSRYRVTGMTPQMVEKLKVMRGVSSSVDTWGDKKRSLQAELDADTSLSDSERQSRQSAIDDMHDMTPSTDAESMGSLAGSIGSGMPTGGGTARPPRPGDRPDTSNLIIKKQTINVPYVINSRGFLQANDPAHPTYGTVLTHEGKPVHYTDLPSKQALLPHEVEGLTGTIGILRTKVEPRKSAGEGQKPAGPKPEPRSNRGGIVKTPEEMAAEAEATQRLAQQAEEERKAKGTEALAGELNQVRTSAAREAENVLVSTGASLLKKRSKAVAKVVPAGMTVKTPAPSEEEIIAEALSKLEKKAPPKTFLTEGPGQ